MILSEYDPNWEYEYRKLGLFYIEILGELLVRIEHVGSTAIYGIKAKPILDIDLVIEDNSVLSEVVKKLKTIGYTHNGDQGIPGREAFLRDDQSVPWNQKNKTWMKHHLYVCTKDSRELDRHIQFRDYLNTNSEAAKEYENIKLEIESRSNGDRKLYADIKENDGVCSAYVERVLAIVAQKKYLRELKYRFSLQLRTINRLISICALPMGLVTRQEGDIITDYFYFCVTKACKSLKAIKLLYENKYFEDSLSLLRSTYESYLNTRFMLYSKDDKRIDFLVRNPIRLNNESFFYLTKENGKKDRNKIIDTGRNKIVDSCQSVPLIPV
ncbi:MAG TPA: GrpB family protein [Clostridiales bacterium]|nr:GrpB family protein [Clostridiales bacterium]HQP69757.1 GrpB family protein [Clostridiales bacterium]